MKHNKNFSRVCLLFITGLLFLISSCSDDDGISLNSAEIISVNEGNFFQANGTFSSFDVISESVTQDVFEAEATIQNAIRFGNRLYIVTNAPDGLIVADIDENTFTEVTTISSGFNGPVGFAAVGNLGFVTNFGDFNSDTFEFENSFVSVIDLNSNEVIDSIDLAVQPQEIIAANGLLYVANQAGSTVSVIDPSDFSTEEISTPAGPSISVLDADGDLWVLCTSGNLIEIDLGTNSISTTIDGLTVAGFDEKMAINSEGSQLYFLGGNNDSFTGLTNVFQVDVSSPNPSVEPFVENGFSFYGIGVDPFNGDVYVGDSNAFQSTGTGFRFSSDGTEITSFATGVGPNSFLFL